MTERLGDLLDELIGEACGFDDRELIRIRARILARYDLPSITIAPTVDDPHEPEELTKRMDAMSHAITQETADDIFNLTAYLSANDTIKETWFGDDNLGLPRLVSSIRFNLKYAPEIARYGDRPGDVSREELAQRIDFANQAFEHSTKSVHWSDFIAERLIEDGYAPSSPHE